jgi:hypothetical protein
LFAFPGLDGKNLLSHPVQGLIPGNPKPAAFSATRLSNHRKLRPFIILDQIKPGCTSRAQSAVDAGCMEIALNKPAFTI